MRLAAWNCYQGTDRKVPTLLTAFQPDIAVIPESSMTPAIATGSLLQRAVPHAWIGDYPNKGLGIYAPGADAIEVVSSSGTSNARHGLPVRAHLHSGSVAVLGIWTHPCPVGVWKSPYMKRSRGCVG